MDRFLFKIGHQKGFDFQEIRLHSQKLLTVLDSIVNIIGVGGLCDRIIAPWPSHLGTSIAFKGGSKTFCG